MRHAFTLIEVLLAVATLALLAIAAFTLVGFAARSDRVTRNATPLLDAAAQSARTLRADLELSCRPWTWDANDGCRFATLAVAPGDAVGRKEVRWWCDAAGLHRQIDGSPAQTVLAVAGCTLEVEDGRRLWLALAPTAPSRDATGIASHAVADATEGNRAGVEASGRWLVDAR